MMTHKEIKAAIERLRVIEPSDYVGSAVVEVVWAFMGGNVSAMELRDTMINLLEQADPDTHMELPRGADGVPVHIGDEMDADHCEGGTVVGIQYYEGVGVLIAVRPRGWDTPSWCDPAGYRHHHKPTVEDLLYEMLAKHNNYSLGERVDGLVADYASKLREVMADDDD